VDIVRAFGRKIGDDQRARHTFHSANLGTRIEVCYNIRYIEPNGRQKGNPWSLRQTGVYQRLDVSEQRSTWVVLQPSKHARANLIPYLEGKDAGNIRCKVTALHVHFVFLYSGIRNWHAYVEYAEAQLRRYVSNTNTFYANISILIHIVGRKGSILAPRYASSLRPHCSFLRHSMSDKAQEQTSDLNCRRTWATQSPARLESPPHPLMRRKARM
jgi:hypothetical protein